MECNARAGVGWLATSNAGFDAETGSELSVEAGLASESCSSFSIHSIMIWTSRRLPSSLEELFAGLLHGFPGRVRIQCHHAVSHRTASAQRNPQIVNGIGAEVGGGVVALGEHALHPVTQSRDFGFRPHRFRNRGMVVPILQSS